ncbi:MAG TPA: tRNA (N(6)-L-threonylcarbamoyladenosine(37)-C(2))-methylthiotransferase MtaB, partial [Bacteroidetes bacterium]|nr:tRNA (N(6)-L-threonylcarbamoyladenosine(37)-C(2))-methylthiotransferase MtaB [Bacteroidota bacterium]
DFEEKPDIFIINTCSVTDFADRKNRKIIRKAKKINPQSKIVVIGCYAQLKPEEISQIEGVDIVLGAGEKFNVDKYLKENHSEKFISCEIEDVTGFHSAYSFGDRTRSFLKIQTGCDYVCTYCTIPKARGKSRSGSSEQIIQNAKDIASKGIKEIVLTGVNIGDYGKGLDEDIDFLGLLKKLDTVDGIERIRISSIEPNLLTDEIIEFVASSRSIVPHFHIPLQSGSDKILQLMKRRYLRELYAKRVEKVKEIMPHACIGVDVIVGFPGETNEEFVNTYNFINSLDVSYLHVFTYSERSGTEAVSMPGVVSVDIRRERNTQLTSLSLKKKYAFYNDFIGSTREVLVEKSKEPNIYTGFTDNYIKVKFYSPTNLENQIVEVSLMDINEDYMVNGEYENIVVN